MGLDMHLEEHVYIGGQYSHREVRGTIDIEMRGESLDIDLSKVKSIVVDRGYWRKANAIHQWFVENVQNGVDECQLAYVERSQLDRLKELCEEALEKKDPALLPPQSGFFFGPTEIDEWYWHSLRATIQIIEDLPEQKGDYYYQSSW